MINKSLESPSEKHPLSLNVYGLRTCIYLLLTCWTPRVNLHANNGSLCMSDCPLTSDHRISLCTDIVTSSPKTQDHKACTLCHLTELVVFTH